MLSMVTGWPIAVESCAPSAVRTVSVARMVRAQKNRPTTPMRNTARTPATTFLSIDFSCTTEFVCHEVPAWYSWPVQSLPAMPFVIRLIVNAAALWVATRVVPGVSYVGGWVPFAGVALVFGVLNATIRPVAKLLTFPLIIVTLGLFALVVNGLMLWLTSSLSAALGLGFRVGGFWPAFWGALVVSRTSLVLSLLMREPPKAKRYAIE